MSQWPCLGTVSAGQQLSQIFVSIVMRGVPEIRVSLFEIQLVLFALDFDVGGGGFCLAGQHPPSLFLLLRQILARRLVHGAAHDFTCACAAHTSSANSRHFVMVDDWRVISGVYDRSVFGTIDHLFSIERLQFHLVHLLICFTIDYHYTILRPLFHRVHIFGSCISFIFIQNLCCTHYWTARSTVSHNSFLYYLR